MSGTCMRHGTPVSFLYRRSLADSSITDASCNTAGS